MSNPRFLPLPAQPQGQGSLPRLIVPDRDLQDIVNGKLPVTSALNASISSAVPGNSTTDILGSLKIAYGVVTFTTTANIAAGSNVWTLTFAVPFVNTPVVICSGGNFVNAWEAWFVTPTQCQMFNVNALVGPGANQSMQWLAIGH